MTVSIILQLQYTFGTGAQEWNRSSPADARGVVHAGMSTVQRDLHLRDVFLLANDAFARLLVQRGAGGAEITPLEPDGHATLLHTHDDTGGDQAQVHLFVQ